MFVAWAETMLVHGEGDLLGQPYKVPEWGKRASWRLFEYDPDDVDPNTGACRFLMREALIVAPKGSAKTELMAALALFLLAGPSQPTPDGPVARTSPNIPVAAASWEQANKLFGHAATNMAKGTSDSPSPLAPFVECFDSEIQLRDAPGAIYRVAAVAGTNDGGLPTAGFADEIHEWTGRKKRVYLVLFQGLDKRHNGQVFSITTPDDADPESLLGEKVAYAEQVASGEVTDPGFYYLRFAAEDGCPIDTEDELTAALDSHPAVWLEPRRLARSLLAKKTPPHEVRRYWLGQFVRGGGHWLPEGAWEARAGASRPDPSTRCVLAFDGSYRRDSTALVGCTLDGCMWVEGHWERPDNARPDWTIPRGEVLAAVAQAMERYEVVELSPDPPGWVTEVEGWEDTYGEVVVRFEMNQTKRMAAACSRFYSAVAGVSPEDADDDLIDLTHDGSPALSRHLRNAVVKNTASGPVITKESKDSPRKIDLAVAAVVAYDRACWHANNVPTDEEVPFAWV